MNTEELNEELKEELNKRVKNINFEKILDLINQGANVNLHDIFGYTALHLASHQINDNEKTIELLLNAGANVNLQSDYGITALHNASQTNDNEKTIELLLNAGANVNLHDKFGETALHIALHYKINEKTIELLLNAGANVNIQNNDGKSSAFGNSVGISTALHYAIYYQNIKCIPLLYLYHYHSIEQKQEYNISSHFAYRECRNIIETLYNLFL